MKYVKLAAIDIGSNSIRLLIVNVIPTEDYTYYRKVSMTRLPIRLGQDVFTTGEISKKNANRMMDAMKAYKYIMKVHGVEDFRACATSAMREAVNGKVITEKISDKTGINIEIVSGQEEAKLVFESKMFDKIQPSEKNFVYVDVGGGSTELTLWRDGAIVDTNSFKIGTVRLLNHLVLDELKDEMKAWVKQATKGVSDIALIGSGGNINKSHKMSGKQQNEPLSLDYLQDLLNRLKAMSTEERIVKLGLNFDRADVIVPALQIYTSVSEWAGASNIYVPKIGVSDGIVREFYHQKYKKRMEMVH